MLDVLRRLRSREYLGNFFGQSLIRPNVGHLSRVLVVSDSRPKLKTRIIVCKHCLKQTSILGTIHEYKHHCSFSNYYQERQVW